MNPYLELCELLGNSLKDCEINHMSAFLGTLKFKINETSFAVTTNKTHYLLASTNGTTASIELIRPVLDKFMGDNQPFCSYDLVYDSGDRLLTTEWDIYDPENRIQLLISGNAFELASVDNIKLYDRDLAKYTSEESRQAYSEAEAERVKNARIYGIDPGYLNPTEIASLSEVDLWLNIDSVGYMIWRTNHDMVHGRIKQVDMTEHQYGLEYLIHTACKKVGIEISEPKADSHISPSDEYRKWYDFYANHFKKVLSDEHWYEFNRARESNSKVSDFLPTGDWRNWKIQ